jgi:hypothetical protein
MSGKLPAQRAWRVVGDAPFVKARRLDLGNQIEKVDPGGLGSIWRTSSPRFTSASGSMMRQARGRRQTIKICGRCADLGIQPRRQIRLLRSTVDQHEFASRVLHGQRIAMDGGEPVTPRGLSLTRHAFSFRMRHNAKLKR